MRDLQSDLSPPLGDPGGPCHVIRRIQDAIDDDREESVLVTQVQHNKAITNQDAAKVYDLEVEPGIGPVRQVVISPHAQYRMDLRSVTTDGVRAALAAFVKQLNDWKSRQDPEYDYHVESLAQREGINWYDKKTKLVVVFRSDGPGRVRLITTYYKGVPDPKIHPGQQCLTAGYQTQDLSGYQTMVQDSHPPRDDTGHEKDQVLPSPPWEFSKPTGVPQYTKPPGSDNALDGKSLTIDRARTKGVPGEDSPPSDAPARSTPVRRPQLQAAVKGQTYPGTHRQHEQGGKAKRYYEKYYRKNQSRIKQRAKKWHRKWKNQQGYKRDQDRREDHPERFERKPAKYRDVSDRSQDWRAEQKNASWNIPISLYGRPAVLQGVTDQEVVLAGGSKYPLEVLFNYVRFEREEDIELVYGHLDRIFDGFDIEARQRKQRGVTKTKTRRNYVKHRSQSIRRAKLRYTKIKKNPTFRRRQALRRAQPHRFRRITGSLLTAPEIAFVFGKQMNLGYVHNVSPMTGLVTFHYTDAVDMGNKVRSVPIEAFLANVIFLSMEDIDSMYELLDNELGVGEYGDAPVDDDVVGDLVYDGDEYPPREEDTGAFYGQVRLAEMLYDKRPPEMDSEQTYNRGTPSRHLWPEHDPSPDPSRGIEVWNNPGSAKVIPEGHDFENKEDRYLKEAVRLSEILDNTSLDVQQKAKGLEVQLQRVLRKNNMWVFSVPGSDKKVYKVRIKVVPSETPLSDPDKMDLLVSCSCPFWQYQGPEHWGTVNGYLYGRPVGTATKPVIKDPVGDHWACKHLVACLRRFSSYKLPIMRVAARYLQLKTRIT